VTTSGKPAAKAGVNAAMLGVIKRKDGSEQVTYNGMPLYYFARDQKPGSTMGQDIDHFGGEWYLVSPQGKKIEGKE
jgi:predicted lipoprotein with Yx(FWY)xxD motif